MEDWLMDAVTVLATTDSKTFIYVNASICSASLRDRLRDQFSHQANRIIR